MIHCQDQNSEGGRSIVENKESGPTSGLAKKRRRMRNENTIGYGSQEARISVSHVTDGELVLQIRRPVDGTRDQLNWICVPLGQLPDFENEVRAAVIWA